MTKTIPANQPLTDRDLQVQNARSQVTRSQPVSLGQGVINYINRAFTAAQERPFTTLLSMGAAFFVKATISTHLAGALMVTGGLPALGVAVAAAMATSVIFGLVGNLFSKNPKSVGQLVSRMAGSGLIAGLFGGILGGYVDVAEAPEVPTHDIAGWEGPDFESDAYKKLLDDVPDEDLRAAIQEGYGPVAKGGFIQEPAVESIGVVGNPARSAMIAAEASAASGNDFYIELNGEQQLIPSDELAKFSFGDEYQDTVNINALLADNPEAEWFVVEDPGAVSDSQGYEVYHRAQFMALIEGGEHQADVMGLESKPTFALQYDNIPEATTSITEGPSSPKELLNRSGHAHDVTSQITLTTSALNCDPDIANSLITRELPAIQWMETNPLGVMLQTPMETELLSDNYAFQAGQGENYENLMRVYVADALDTGTPDASLSGQPSMSDRLTNLMDHAATNHFSDQYLETMQDQLANTQEKMNEYMELYDNGNADNTPANYEDNVERFDEIAKSQQAKIESIEVNKLAFKDAILELQSNISADDKLNGKMDLMQMWQDAQDRAAGIDVGEKAASDHGHDAPQASNDGTEKQGYWESLVSRTMNAAVGNGKAGAGIG